MHRSAAEPRPDDSRLLGKAEEEALVAAALLRAGRDIHALSNVIANLRIALSLLRDESTPSACRASATDIALRSERRIRSFIACGHL